MFSNIRILVSGIPSSPVFQYRASRQKSARVYFQALENVFLSETKADVQNEIYIREICIREICKKTAVRLGYYWDYVFNPMVRKITAVQIQYSSPSNILWNRMALLQIIR